MIDGHNKLTNIPVHIIYALTLIFLVATRYYVYIGPGREFSSINFGQALGANLGYFLIWGLGYYFCATTPRKGLVTTIGFISVMAGPLIAPVVGYALVLSIYFIRKKQIKNLQDAPGGKHAVPPPAYLPIRKRVSRFFRNRFNPRMASGFLLIAFWGLFAAYHYTRSGIIAAAMFIVIVMTLLCRFFPVHVNLYYSRFLSWVTWGKERQVNRFFGMLDRLHNMDTKKLNSLLREPNPYVQEAVLDQLKDRGNEETVRILKEMAEKGAEASLSSILETLGEIAGPEHSVFVARFLEHKESGARLHAAICLDKMGAADKADSIIDAIERETDLHTLKVMFMSAMRLDGTEKLVERWEGLSVSGKSTILRKIHDDAESLKDKADGLILAAENDSDREVSAYGRRVRRLMILHRTRDMFPDIFSYGKDDKFHNERPFQITNIGTHIINRLEAGDPRIKTVIRESDDFLLHAGFYYRGGEEGTDVIRLLLNHQHHRDVKWQLESLITIDDFFDAFARSDLSSTGTYFLKCPQRYKDAFADRLMISNACSFNDGRDIYEFELDGERIGVLTKYMTYSADIAFPAPIGTELPVLLVRFRDILDYEEYEEIPPFVVRFDLADILTAKRDVGVYDQGSQSYKEILSPYVKMDIT